MKRLIFCSLLIVTSILINAQIVEKNGKYYDLNDNLYTGEYTEFYDNGNLKMMMNLENGLIIGEVSIYYENGNLNEQREYKND